ncbi:flagellar filament capping protein FliD [Acetobacterium fimetarium]|uniref:Flagellar hook-associated protein 2 n=1 Tax=Acetobacterium fimetarium TaxID=52691 RepID=A0ABR6WX51_9FIRM|nr:flagellar filament capping protein FliD [Acetobacterium fimetarium]MBC3804826.1 flagellar filament capping protein FliD [Acetobacterium fimetarium]
MSTVSSTSSSTASTLTGKTGIGGLVSGMDTDSLVESLTTGSRTKITKEEAKVTKMEWKQTAYRDVTKALKEFQSKYLDVLSSKNMRSDKLFSTVAASTTSTNITATATNAAMSGSITINSITKLATKATVSSAAKISKDLTGSAITVDNSTLVTNLSGKSLKMTLDGTVKTITFDISDTSFKADGSNFLTALQEKVTAAFGNKSADVPIVPMVRVGLTDGKLSFTSADSGSQITVNDLSSKTPVLASLGMTSGQTNKLSTGTALGDLPLRGLDASAQTFSFSVNSVDFTFNRTDSLSTIMGRINSSSAGVTMGYSALTDKFTMTADESGSTGNIVISDAKSDGIMAAFGLKDRTVTAGQNAEFMVNGQSVTRTSNSVTVDGVKIDLLKETNEASTITLKEDTTTLKETITSYVNDYNTLIDKMNSLVKEKYDSDYQPLTDDQKKDMSDTEVEQWEKKAKTGLLTGDSTIRGITAKMQSLMYSSAVAGGISLFNMGITSAGYSENGKLKIDETKLDAALASQTTAVKELFTSEKTGLSNQLNDIINGASKTSGVKGTRGSLVELAGYEATLSNTENSITTNITKANKSIKEMKAKLKEQETYYWSKFTAMETAIQSLNTQSSMLTSFSAS